LPFFGVTRKEEIRNAAHYHRVFHEGSILLKKSPLLQIERSRRACCPNGDKHEQFRLRLRRQFRQLRGRRVGLMVSYVAMRSRRESATVVLNHQRMLPQPVVVEQVISPVGSRASDIADFSCTGDAKAAQIVNTAATILSTGDLSSAPGSFGTAEDAKAPTLKGQRALITEVMGRNNNQSILCHPLIAVIPANSHMTGFKYSARDSLGMDDCTLDQNGEYVCGVGLAEFSGPPSVTSAGKFLLVTGIFMNRSHDQQRTANMTIYYRPGL
jgi:hypothetical protein